ncbi:hypothetical protein GLOTRDRAFT_123940 [Gloeophyllum trabeum ATCC 11539]|uniref:Uncharacterized protein n=1 Tax=Gloeophyllum trabeum (strain ATCC 11539 / FP-39264 / Madison 617) TaxID=670483 RepID=S7QLE9_GLOTA|nr:uncharacterized protein GLOTRDRAFT_123940 [Gloeophyllum trabeum ATCC 11539]EPQ60183.1 hypothetical protein GLOTRDRAFT_123940 [Gloeophyllum trabeum ATCC 11539]
MAPHSPQSERPQQWLLTSTHPQVSVLRLRNYVPKQPVVKVGGRRLSLNSNTNRPRLRKTSASEPIDPGVTTHDPPADYPRPNGQSGDHDGAHHHNEEEIPRREKRQGHNNTEKELKIRENARRKAEMNRPSKDIGFGGKDGARGGRIAQPAGKGVAI